MTPAKRQPAPPFCGSAPANPPVKRRWLLILAATLEIAWIVALVVLATK
jgi:hypothetical protein